MNEVNVFTSTGLFSHTIGRAQHNEACLFSFPWGVAVGGNSKRIAASSNVIPANSNVVPANSNAGISDANGEFVVVSDFTKNALFIFARNGTLTRVIHTVRIDTHTAFFNPYSISVSPAGSILACDHVKNMVCVYTLTGVHLDTYTLPRYATTEDYETSMYAGANPIDDTFVVVQAFKSASQRAIMHVISSEGVHVRSLELQESETLAVVTDVCVGMYGEVFVADEHLNVIWVFSPHGDLIRAVSGTPLHRHWSNSAVVGYEKDTPGLRESTTGLRLGEVSMGKPRGLAVMRDNRIMVSDFDNNRVLVLGQT